MRYWNSNPDESSKQRKCVHTLCTKCLRSTSNFSVIITKIQKSLLKCTFWWVYIAEKKDNYWQINDRIYFVPWQSTDQEYNKNSTNRNNKCLYMDRSWKGFAKQVIEFAWMSKSAPISTLAASRLEMTWPISRRRLLAVAWQLPNRAGINEHEFTTFMTQLWQQRDCEAFDKSTTFLTLASYDNMKQLTILWRLWPSLEATI